MSRGRGNKIEAFRGKAAAPGEIADPRNCVIDSTLVPYRQSHTYEILPLSDTGTYYAGGVLIGSTLAPMRNLASTAAPSCNSDLR
jgi:hypothetical protein